MSEESSEAVCGRKRSAPCVSMEYR